MPDKIASEVTPKPPTKLSKIYNLEKFAESDISKFKRFWSAYKKRASKNARDPKTYKEFLFKRVPILNWLPKYKIRNLLPDSIAGFTVGVMNIPQVI